MNKQLFRVLIAEDIPGESLLIEEVLRGSDIIFSPSCVSNQQDFKSELQEFIPDIIISCDTNPRLSGIWVVSETRKWSATVPVVVVSDLYEQAHVVKYFEAGAADFISYDQLVFLPLIVKRLLEINEAHVPANSERVKIAARLALVKEEE